MRIIDSFVDDLIEQAVEEILETNISASIPHQILLIKAWVQEMEYDRPRNRPEKILFEHLEAAIDRLVIKQRDTMFA